MAGSAANDSDGHTLSQHAKLGGSNGPHQPPLDSGPIVGGETVPFVAKGVEKVDEDAFPESVLLSALERLVLGEVRDAGEASEL